MPKDCLAPSSVVGWISSERMRPALFLAALGVSLLMLWRTQVRGDQLNLLARGWLLAFEGEWVMFGHPMSGGGKIPGGLTSLLTGLPLLLWADPRAPVVLILASHVAAYGLVDRVVRDLLGPKERLALAVLYWANPWRMYFGSLLWNPSYLFLCGAIHLWTMSRQRRLRSFWLSLLHVAAIGCALQLHASFLLLVAASLALLWRGFFRIHLWGAGVGVFLVGASLVPWALEFVDQPSFPATETDWLRQFSLVPVTLFRLGMYWLRFVSLSLGSAMRCFDFVPALGEELGGALGGLASSTTVGILALSVGLPLWANYRLWRGAGSWWCERPDDSDSGRQWLVGATRWCLVSAIPVCLLSPSSLMSWHLVLMFHAAVLAVVLAVGPLLERASPLFLAAGGGWTVAALGLGLAVGLGAPLYSCGDQVCGRQTVRPPLRGDPAMLSDLGIQERCAFELEVENGWWMDVLPEPDASPVRR